MPFKKLHIEDKNTGEIVGNISYSLLLKGGALVVGFLTTPAYIRFFSSSSVLGVWFSILSVLNLMLFFDFGVGNGLRNVFVELYSAGKNDRLKSYISTAYIYLTGICITIIVLSVFLFRFINWNALFNLSADLLAPAIFAKGMTILFAGVMLQIALRLTSSLLLAMQNAALPNLFALATNLFLLVGIALCNFTGHNDDFVFLSYLYVLSVTAPLVLATVIIFGTKLKNIRPTLHCFEPALVKEVGSTGNKFLVIQIAVQILCGSVTAYAVNVFVDAANVVTYSLYYKVYHQVFVVYGIILAPIWSAVTKALVEERYEWLSKTVKKAALVGVAIFLAQFAVLPLMQTLFDIWLGADTITLSMTSLLLFTFGNGIILLLLFFFHICSGLGELDGQFLWGLIGGLAFVVLSYFLTKYARDYNTVVLAQTLAAIPYCAFEFVWLNKRLRKIGVQR